ncbi:hypothetical protein [Falsiroseomonas stagni]|uniref:Uncharacterized protein n=1 Tax=Falsiroseomonas stagni DSM 19981 TaxID=1123062 RepID=A0A1I4APP0_9PROT|nr:hypothetical protein [Falsiroseomonas stagni]SFK58445.1 hypothetical protein SAMN02745775_10454 [Falsiroseomonas stagni DSM 19981]
MDSGTLKLFAAIFLFSLPVLLGTPQLTGRRIGNHVVTKAEAQALTAIAGLALGVGYLLVVG